MSWPSDNLNLLEKGYWEPGRPAEPEPERTLTQVKRAILGILKPPFASTTAAQTSSSSSISNSSTTSSPRSRPKRTAYLDGVRGFAALLVYLHHHQLWAHNGVDGDRILETTYGYNRQYYFASLPFVRMFFSGGHFAVTVFFVLSGYVLSAKPLTMIHSAEYMRLGHTLASALFRRWLRLYIPVICTTFLYMTSWHVLGYIADPLPCPTYLEDLWNWYAELKNFSFVFRTGGDPWFSYNFHLWSIPVEFRGSVIIYTALLALSRCTRNARLGCELFLIFYFMYIVDGWFGSAFVSGMLLCDLDLLAASDTLPPILSRLRSKVLSTKRFKTLIFHTLLLASLYLGGVPSFSADINILKASPGWSYLSSLKPQAVFDYKWFYLFWAATFLVASIPHIGWLKAFFETRFTQYLGRISFAFYLVHGPILWAIGDRIYAAAGWPREPHINIIPGWIDLVPLPRQGPFGLELSFWLPQLILLPVTLWVAEVVTNLVDEPSVTFSLWLYRKTLSPAGATKL